LTSLPNFDGTQPCAQVDPEAYFPQGSLRHANRVAIKICDSCHFFNVCLNYALEYKVDGIWGGTTVNQRKVIRKERGIVGLPVVNQFSTAPIAVRAKARREKNKENLKQKGIDT